MARETEEYLEQSNYCVRALTAISNKLASGVTYLLTYLLLASGVNIDELFPTLCYYL